MHAIRDRGDEAFAMSQYMLRHYRMELNGEYATAH